MIEKGVIDLLTKFIWANPKPLILPHLFTRWYKISSRAILILGRIVHIRSLLHLFQSHFLAHVSERRTILEHFISNLAILSAVSAAGTRQEIQTAAGRVLAKPQGLWDRGTVLLEVHVRVVAEVALFIIYRYDIWAESTRKKEAYPIDFDFLKHYLSACSFLAMAIEVGLRPCLLLFLWQNYVHDLLIIVLIQRLVQYFLPVKVSFFLFNFVQEFLPSLGALAKINSLVLVLQLCHVVPIASEASK